MAHPSSRTRDSPFASFAPEDAPALQRALGRCTERTIYLRFFGSLEELSDEQARYFASTDGVDHFGLVALDPEDQEEIIAVVRSPANRATNEPSTQRSLRIVGRGGG